MARRRIRLTALILAVSVSLIVASKTRSAPSVGYTDTPMLPDSSWRVHDANRPQPPVVTVAPQSDGAAPPSDAIVLFDGTDLSRWRGVVGLDKKKKYNPTGEANWKIEDGYMEANKTGDLISKDAFGDCQLHIEFATPAKVEGESQGRGNSGIFLMSQYEIQILDSFENPTYADGGAGSVYGQRPPMVNVARGPGQWQSFDIVFIAPRFEGQKVVSPARVTVIHNAVVVQHGTPLLGATTHKRLPGYRIHPDKLPIRLQDHNNPIRFRNIWIRPLDRPEP